MAGHIERKRTSSRQHGVVTSTRTRTLDLPCMAKPSTKIVVSLIVGAVACAGVMGFWFARGVDFHETQILMISEQAADRSPPIAFHPRHQARPGITPFASSRTPPLSAAELSAKQSAIAHHTATLMKGIYEKVPELGMITLGMKKDDAQTLLESWQLPVETIDQVIDVFTSMNQEELALGHAFLTREISLNQRQSRGRSNREEAEKKIEGLLGPERAADFGRWEQSWTDRQRLEKLAKSGLQLSDEQEESLLSVLYTARMEMTDGGKNALRRNGGAYPKRVMELIGEQLAPEQAQLLEALLRSKD